MLEKNIYFLENVGDMSGLPTAGKGMCYHDEFHLSKFYNF